MFTSHTGLRYDVELSDRVWALFDTFGYMVIFGNEELWREKAA